jgi:uracil-DNA glycosylase
MSNGDNDQIQLESSWKERLASEFLQPYMHNLKAFLLREKAAGKSIYPKGSNIFNALNSTPFDRVKVVILGQDPYHGPNQAHGLSFSVQKGVPIPPSLKNIYQELTTDIGFIPPNHGCLESWAREGVLLLNSVLTVEKNKPASHQGKGWEQFTDRIVALLNQEREHLVFMLWGAYAKKKGAMLDRNRHLVLEAAHPSPFSVQGFFGCRHFSHANQYLEANGIAPITWQIS